MNRCDGSMVAVLIEVWGEGRTKFDDSLAVTSIEY
jgi:hypothetical protein